ncbi:MAG TPA: FadR/GntR family transcriptional regulator [Mycobacteriales bacterium]|nr:FadR/GntR family transcriptional regulator [Mycobacteriales bacterium]
MTSPPDGLSPVPRTRLYELLAERLAAHVQQAGLQPGDRFPAERDLARMFGVSRSSLRQALVSLEVQGVVTIRHGGGVFLAAPAEHDPLHGLWDRRQRLSDIYDVREALEVKIAQLAAVHRSDHDLRRIEEALAEMTADLAAGGIGAHADASFHAAVTSAAHNPVMVDLMAYVSAQIWESRIESLSQPGRPPRSLAGHQEIATAIVDRDPDGAADAMRAHIALVATVTPEAASAAAPAEADDGRPHASGRGPQAAGSAR